MFNSNKTVNPLGRKKCLSEKLSVPKTVGKTYLSKAQTVTMFFLVIAHLTSRECQPPLSSFYFMYYASSEFFLWTLQGSRKESRRIKNKSQ